MRTLEDGEEDGAEAEADQADPAIATDAANPAIATDAAGESSKPKKKGHRRGKGKGKGKGKTRELENFEFEAPTTAEGGPPANDIDFGALEPGNHDTENAASEDMQTASDESIAAVMAMLTTADGGSRGRARATSWLG